MEHDERHLDLVTVTDGTPRHHDDGSRRRNPRGQGDRLREELIEAAQHLLATAAHPDDVSIRAVARQAGVSPTAAYRHFEDRDDLVRSAVYGCFEEFSAELLDRVLPFSDPFERLRAAGHAYLDFANAEHGHYRVIFSNPMMPEKTDDEMSGATAFELLVGLVQDCLDAGSAARTDDATYLSYQVWTWIHGIVDLRITHCAMEWPDAQRMFDDVLTTLGLTPASP